MAAEQSCTEDDIKLLQLMIAGEERGLVSLYRKYQSQVYRFALQVSGARHVAEAVTQEPFLALIRSPHKYREEPGSFAVPVWHCTKDGLEERQAREAFRSYCRPSASARGLHAGFG